MQFKQKAPFIQSFKAKSLHRRHDWNCEIDLTVRQFKVKTVRYPRMNNQRMIGRNSIFSLGQSCMATKPSSQAVRYFELITLKVRTMPAFTSRLQLALEVLWTVVCDFHHSFVSLAILQLPCNFSKQVLSENTWQNPWGSLLWETVQGSTIRPFPGCGNAEGKFRQKWWATAGTKFTKPLNSLTVQPCMLERTQLQWLAKIWTSALNFTISFKPETLDHSGGNFISYLTWQPLQGQTCKGGTAALEILA